LCEVRNTSECTLTQPGPYRLFLHEAYGTETSYTLRMPRLSHSAGCPVLPLAPFGDPGDAVGSGTLAGWGGIACHAVNAVAAGRVAVRISPNPLLTWAFYDADGQVICGKYSDDCRLSVDGQYTLLVQNDHLDLETQYAVAVTTLAQTAGCAEAVGTSWDQPTVLVHQTSAAQINCQPFHGEAGDRVITPATSTVYNEVAVQVVDDAGVILCTENSEEDGCVLPATGTYRVLSYLWNWDGQSDDLTYKLQVRRLSDAVGCPTITLGTYNAAPSGPLGGIRCRTLDIAAPGRYLAKAVDTENYPVWARFYDSTGHRVCGGTQCDFATPGRYTMVFYGKTLNDVVDDDVEHAVALIPVTPSGCDQVSDAGYQDDPWRGEFAAAGQYDCLQLPSPAGSRIVELLPGNATGVAVPTVSVVDSTGAGVCDSTGTLQTSCELTGTAPFFAVINARDGFPTGSYALAFARVDGAPSCPVLPRDATGTTVATGADRFAVCFSIPADQHASRETFTFSRTSGDGSARMTLFDETGIRSCASGGSFSDRTITCSLPAGPATLILQTDAVDATYRLTHRDASTPAS
jgi:hypothetical protein